MTSQLTTNKCSKSESIKSRRIKLPLSSLQEIRIFIIQTEPQHERSIGEVGAVGWDFWDDILLGYGIQGLNVVLLMCVALDLA